MKKLLTLFLLIFIGINLYASSTDYAAAVTATMSDSDYNSGLGKVYIKAYNGNRTPGSDGAKSASTGTMTERSSSEYKFKVTLGAIMSDPDYYVKEWIGDNGTTIPATESDTNTSETTVSNLSGSKDDTSNPNRYTYTAKFVRRLTDGDIVINSSAGRSASCRLTVYRTTSLTRGEIPDEYKNKFSLGEPQKVNETTWELTVTATDSAEDGDKFVVTVTNEDGAKANVTVSFVENQKVIFIGSSLGAYGVSYGDKYSATIDEQSDTISLDIDDPANFSITFNNIIPINSAYRFNRFKLTPKDETKQPYYLYDDDQNGITQSELISETTTIEPEFVPANSAQFIILKSDTTIHYSDLDRAIAVAVANNYSVVAVYRDLRVLRGDTVYLPTRDYTIPKGITLLIPGNDTYTYRNGDVVLSDFQASNWNGNQCKCRLKMQPNTTITVEGNISVYAVMSMNMRFNGTALTYGEISMADNCHITLHKGAVLSALGYITGNPETSSVTAESGATVYEAFQIRDWRGGTATIDLAGVDLGDLIGGGFGALLGKDLVINATGNSNDVFPIGQYYIQNIETKLVLKSGAVEKLATAVDMSVANVEANALFVVPDDYDEYNGVYKTGLFRMGKGSQYEKYYDKDKDRQCIKIKGTKSANTYSTVELDQIELAFSTEISSIPTKIYISSALFNLPITNNLDIEVEDAYVSSQKPLAFLAGSTMKVNKSSKIFVDSDMYVYDKEQNTGYFYNGAIGDNSEIIPVAATSKGGSPTIRPTTYPTEDATWIIDGEMEVRNGGLYTTYYTGGNGKSTNELDYGAHITSTGNGKVIFKKVVTDGLTHQYDQKNSADIDIPVTNARLSNDTAFAANKAEPYSAGSGAQKGVYYTYVSSQGKWLLPQALTIANTEVEPFYITLPQDTIQEVICIMQEDASNATVTLANFDVALQGASDSRYEIISTKYEKDNEDGLYKLRIKVKYTHQRKHNVESPYIDSLVVKCKDLTILEGDPVKDRVAIALEATEDYTPNFSVAINGITVVDGGTYDVSGTLGAETKLPVVITPAEKNVATLSIADGLNWNKVVASPFSFAFGATLGAAELTYKPNVIESGADYQLKIIATYTDAVPKTIRDTVTITLKATSYKQPNNLTFVTLRDTVVQGGTIDNIFAKLGTGINNITSITYKDEDDFEATTTNDLVSIRANDSGNYILEAQEVASIVEPRVITIVVTQDENSTMYGGTATMEVVVLPVAIWHWSDLYFGSTNINPVTPPQENQRWTLELISCEENLLALSGDWSSGYTSTVGTPSDITRTYTARFRFTQGTTKEFISNIYADPRIVPYCVDQARTYKGVTLASSNVVFDDNNDRVNFVSGATISSWTIELKGVPDKLKFKHISSSKAWTIEAFNGRFWDFIHPWEMLAADSLYEFSLEPEVQQLRFSYAAGDGDNGVLENVCITALDGVSANANKVYMPVAKDATGSVLPTSQKVVLYSVIGEDLSISLSTADMALDVVTLPAAEGGYAHQEVLITNNGSNTSTVQYLYVKNGAETLLTLPIQPFEFRQGLPVNSEEDPSERYYYLTTASASDTWANQTDNVRWDMANKMIVFNNPGSVSATRSVTLAFEGCPDYISFHTSSDVNLSEWSFEESDNGLAWNISGDTAKSVINNGKGIYRELHYTTRYVRITYTTNNLSRVLVSNLKIEGTPHLIANPTKMTFNDDVDNYGNMGLLTLTTMNLQEIRVESNDSVNFKIIYDGEDYSKQVGKFVATSTDYPNALGINKMGDIQLGVVWRAVNTVDDATLTVYNTKNDSNPMNDSVLAVIHLLGAKGMITHGNAKTTIYTGIPDGTVDPVENYTYHGSRYTDYKYHQVDLSNAFDDDGYALFDYLFIYGKTTPSEGNNITPPGVWSTNESTLYGSNAVTPFYVYKKAYTTSLEAKGYEFVGQIDNVNTSDKDTVGDVIVADDNGVVYIDVNQSLKVYMTGFCPYATTGYTKNQEGVFLFRGVHGSKLDVYLEDFHVYSRNKSKQGHGFSNKNGGEVFTDGYARGSGGVLVFENMDPQEQLQNYQPFDVSIHTIGDNFLSSNNGCFFGLSFSQSGEIAMKATQVSSPIHIHMYNKDYARKTKTTLNFDDIWPNAATVNANGSFTSTYRTNGFLALKKQSNNAPSIDMGNKHTVVNFYGGRVELQNSQIGSDTYKTTLAISHRSGYFGAEDVGIQLCYGIGTDSVGGTVKFYDGTVTVRPMKVNAAYQQYYLMDPQLDTNGDTIKQDGAVVNSDLTSCLRLPQNTYVYGGSHCMMRACQHVTSKGGAPKDGPKGKPLGQYVYTMFGGDTQDPTTKLAKIVEFPDNLIGLRDYQRSQGYTYGLNSVTPDGDKLYFWIPEGYGGVKPEQDKFMSIWKACMTEIGAGIQNVAEGSIGGDTPIEPNEEVKYFLYCQIDENIHQVISAGYIPDEGGDKVYTYQAPIEVPTIAQESMGKYIRWAPSYVSDSTQYQVLSDTLYTITDRVYYITNATADIWQTFTAPFDVAKIYVVETYKEDSLAAMGTRDQILREQARHNADFAAFFAVAMAMGTDKDFDGIYQSYKKWAYTEDKKNGIYSGDEANYNLRSMQELTPYFGNNWRDANFYLNVNRGDWALIEDEYGDPTFDVKWEILNQSDTTDGILLHKDSTYSMMFPYCTGCDVTIEERQDWDYWSGKFLIFESTNAPQTIKGRDFLNDTISGNVFSQVTADNEVIVTGNSTFSMLETDWPNLFVYDEGEGFYKSEGFLPKENDNDVVTIYPTTAFLYGNVPANPISGMPAKKITRDGKIIYGASSNGDNNNDDNNNPDTGSHTPTVGGGNDMFITAIDGGINIAVAAPQYVRVLTATGAIIFNGYITTAADANLPTQGIYVISGENEVQKIFY